MVRTSEKIKKDLHETERHVAAVLNDGRDFRHEFRVVREDGEIRWFSLCQ